MTLVMIYLAVTLFARIPAITLLFVNFITIRRSRRDVANLIEKTLHVHLDDDPLPIEPNW